MGAVFGVQGLYIADASVLPTALDRHPTLHFSPSLCARPTELPKDCRSRF